MLAMNCYLHALNRICEDVQQNMASLNETDEIEWTVNVEILLFYAMIGHKPVGVNRHFMMLFIHHKFSTYINRQISSKPIWNHLDSMYDMSALHESEIVPFPNDEVDFELPEDCYDLVYKKFGVSLHSSSNESEIPKNDDAKIAKKINTSKVKQNSIPVNNTKTSSITPVISKPAKTYVGGRTEPKPAIGDSSSKLKQEPSISSKLSKIKRSSSPFSKKVKNEPNVSAKEDSLDVPKKVNKHEMSGNSSGSKKIMKTTSTNNTVKKSIKTDQNLNVIKQEKVEPFDGAGKKVKTENLSKKGKVSTPTESSSVKKNVKLENNNVRKKHDTETPLKKSSDSGSKALKADGRTPSVSSKGPKLDDVDVSIPSGSRKSPVVKIENTDSVKKQRRQKLSESTKKSSSAKRRR